MSRDPSRKRKTISSRKCSSTPNRPNPRTSVVIGPGLHDYFAKNQCFEENHSPYLDALNWIYAHARKKEENEACLFQRIKDLGKSLSEKIQLVTELEQKVRRSEAEVRRMNKYIVSSTAKSNPSGCHQTIFDIDGLSDIVAEDENEWQTINSPSSVQVVDLASSIDLVSPVKRTTSEARRDDGSFDPKLGSAFVYVERLEFCSISKSKSVVTVYEDEDSSCASKTMTFGREMTAASASKDQVLHAEHKGNEEQSTGPSHYNFNLNPAASATAFNSSPEMTFGQDLATNSSSSIGQADTNEVESEEFVNAVNEDMPRSPAANSPAAPGNQNRDDVEYLLEQSTGNILSSLSSSASSSGSIGDSSFLALEWKDFGLLNGNASPFKIVSVHVDVQSKKRKTRRKLKLTSSKKYFVARITHQATYNNGTGFRKYYQLSYYRRKVLKVLGEVESVFAEPILPKMFLCDEEDVAIHLPWPVVTRRGGLTFHFNFEPFNIPLY